MKKPIRLFWSPLTRRIYATRSWKEDRHGYVIVTGEKFGVTDDIGRIVTTEKLEFTPVKKKAQLEAHKEEGGMISRHDTKQPIDPTRSILDGLYEKQVCSVSQMPDGRWLVEERCDEYFGAILTTDQLRQWGEELIALSQKAAG